MTERAPKLRKILLDPEHQTEETLKLNGIMPDQIKQLVDVKQQYPYVEMFESKQMNHLGFLKWRVENDKTIRPDNFESTLILGEEQLLVPQEFIFMSEFDLTQENDVLTMAELLSKAAQGAVNNLEDENIKPINLNNGDESIKKIFKTPKGRATIEYNKTKSFSNRSVGIKLEELLYSEEIEPVLYTPLEGIIHLDSSKFMIRVTPDPFNSAKKEISRYENYLDRGSIIDIKESAHAGATAMAEIMHLYVSNNYYASEAL